MSRLRNDNRILIVLTLAVVALLLSIVGCERKIVGDVQVDETVSDQCFNCHNGQLDVMQGEWANSVHASGANVDYTSRDGSDCTRCHNQEGFLTWINTGTILATTGNAKAIGCFACPNPHENGDMRLDELNTTDCVADLSPRPLFIGHGSQDDMVPIDSAITLYDAAGQPKFLYEEPEAGHNFCDHVGYHEACQAQLLAFFDTYLLES